MNALRLSVLGCLCLVLGLAGCGKIKEAAKKKVEDLHVKQKTDNVSKAIVGAWEVVKSDNAGLVAGSVVELTKDGKLKMVGGPVKEGTYEIVIVPGPSLEASTGGDKIKMSRKEGDKTIEDTLTIKTLKGGDLVLEDEKEKTVELKKDNAPPTAVNRRRIGGTWEVVKLETAVEPAKGAPAWEFTPGSFTNTKTQTIKSITDKVLTLADDTGKAFALSRRGNVATGATDKEKLVGTWETTSGSGLDVLNIFRKDGKYRSGLVGSDKTDIVMSAGTYAVDGDKLKLTELGDGKLKRLSVDLGFGPSGSMPGHYVLRGDKLWTFAGLDGMRAWTIKSLTDSELVLVDDKKKTDTFKKK